MGANCDSKLRNDQESGLKNGSSDGQSDGSELVESFEIMNLKEELIRGIYEFGLKEPTFIQRRALKPCLNERNVLIQALLGSGKLAMFSITILQRIDPLLDECQALILVPNREVALQIQKVFLAVGKFMENLKCHTCIGGTNLRECMRGLEGAHIVVGTPGRVYDMINRKCLKIDQVKIFVLDEAHEMLSESFIEQNHKVFQYLPQNVQFILSSAVTSQHGGIGRFCEQFMSNPLQITIGKEEFNFDGIQQFYISVVDRESKLDKLWKLFETCNMMQVVIFCETRRRVSWLTNKMMNNDYEVLAMMGEMSPTEREQIIEKFRAKFSQVLITTDRGRGIDIPVPYVINFDFPSQREHYVNRIMHESIFARECVVINMITIGEKDTALMNDIKQFYNISIEEMLL